MGWHYQARKTECVTILPDDEHLETLYELVEVFPDIEPCEDGQPSHTVEAVTVCGETQEDLAKWLRKAADDVERYGVIDGGEVVTDLRNSAVDELGQNDG